MQSQTSYCVGIAGILVLGLGLGFYSAGEIVACVVVASFLIFTAGLLLLGAYFAWHTGKAVLAQFTSEVPNSVGALDTWNPDDSGLGERDPGEHS
jgi:hypothetical protein